MKYLYLLQDQEFFRGIKALLKISYVTDIIPVLCLSTNQPAYKLFTTITLPLCFLAIFGGGCKYSAISREEFSFEYIKAVNYQSVASCTTVLLSHIIHSYVQCLVKL